MDRILIVAILSGGSLLLAPRARSSEPTTFESADFESAAFEDAKASARIAGYSLSKVQRWLHEKALKRIEPDTGLYHPEGRFNYEDAWADCYPFLVWAAWATDAVALEGPVRQALHAEIAHCPEGFFERPENAFGGSEYVKDGLIAIVEVTGRDEWLDRMRAIEDAIWTHPSLETPYGRIPSDDIEIHGEQLQALVRLYTITGEERYIEWAERIADHYLLRGDFVPRRLRDHGCEIIGGLGLLLGVASERRPERAKVYEPHVRRMLDAILARGVNEDGIMYNHLDAPGALSDGWGYNYVSYLCYDLAAGEPVYRARVERTLQSLSKPLYASYPWEGSIDGYADSIEGAIYLLNRVPSPTGLAWVDREMAENVTRAKDPLPTARLWGTMKLESNAVRTVILHALMHTRGTRALPWRQDLELGAQRSGERLAVVVRSASAWTGRLHFDVPRHRIHMGFRRDWPRMNTLPEWFTAEPDTLYELIDGRDGSRRALRGRELAAGAPLALAAGEEARLFLRPVDAGADGPAEPPGRSDDRGTAPARDR